MIRRRFAAFALIPAVASLSGCFSTFQNLTPAQKAQLLCLGTDLGSQIAANHANPVRAASYQADGTILCTFATGAAVVVQPSTGAAAPATPKS